MLAWAAIVPSIFLISLVLRQDKVEKEPTGLLVRLFILGALSIIPAALIELGGTSVIESAIRDSGLQNYLMFLLVVPIAEEGVKFAVLLTTWKNKAFNFTFDGIVYAVIASLGFATLENLLYVLGNMSMGVAVLRGFTSVPLHCTCGVFMGFYYGMARNCHAQGDRRQMRINFVMTLLAPILIHGLYDYALTVDNAALSLAGLGFTLLMLVVAVVQVRSSSKLDSHIAGTEIPVQTQVPPPYQAMQQAPQQYQQPVQQRAPYPPQYQPQAQFSQQYQRPVQQVPQAPYPPQQYPPQYQSQQQYQQPVQQVPQTPYPPQQYPPQYQQPAQQQVPQAPYPQPPYQKYQPPASDGGKSQYPPSPRA